MARARSKRNNFEGQCMAFQNRQGNLNRKMESLPWKRIFRTGGVPRSCVHHRICGRIRIDLRLQSERWQTCMANTMGRKNEGPVFCCEKWELDTLNTHIRREQFVRLWYA